jgi:hypothetical protein
MLPLFHHVSCSAHHGISLGSVTPSSLCTTCNAINSRRCEEILSALETCRAISHCIAGGCHVRERDTGTTGQQRCSVPSSISTIQCTLVSLSVIPQHAKDLDFVRRAAVLHTVRHTDQ